MKKLFLCFMLIVLLPLIANARQDNTTIPDQSSNFKTTEEILEMVHNKTPTDCASEIFSKALLDNANNISETDTEIVVRAWAKNTMLDAPVLKQVIQCPEITSVSEDTTVIFTPIQYTFPQGRTITINYSTQPKVLKQHLLLATKRSLPNGEVNPKLMDPDDPAKYMNTEPSWYAIMVVQHDSLSEFVGPDKNNTLSLKYLNDHIGDIYPKGYHCTSKSAITPGNNYDTINKVVHEVVGLEKDSNDYYVAGDVNLEWVMYAEIAAEVIITVVTWGGGAFAAGAAKGARATRTGSRLAKSVKTLSKADKVKDYINVGRKISTHTDDIAKLEKTIAHANDYGKAIKKAEKAAKAGKDASKYYKEADKALDAAKALDKTMDAEKIKDITKLEKTLNDSKNTLKQLEESAKVLEKSDDVKKYKEAADAFTEVMKYRRALRAARRPQTGNIVARTLNKLKGLKTSAKAAKGGTKLLDKAGRIARAGMSSRSARIGDWLLDKTLKHGSRLAKFISKTGFLYGAVAFLGDMFDKTSATSKEFSNGIEFKPLCLLSADDLEGQENVVNYGMWLMWEGNSTDPSDDDAAYLQVMDFAEKFYYKLDEYQDEHGAECNVDIYVVHPIIRLDETNVEDPKGEMFYLFMNETPWSTAEQFGDQIADIPAWERTQKQLEEEDPDNKYKKPESENNQDNLDENAQTSASNETTYTEAAM